MGTKTQYIEAMRSFVFQGISLGDSEDVVEDCFSESEYDEDASDPKAGINAYRVSASGVDLAMLWFFNDRLYMVQLIYCADRLNSMGDWTAIGDRLVAQFGRAKGDSPGVFPQDEKGQFAQFDWRFDEIDRSITLEIFNEFARVTFADDNTGLAAFNKKKREADLGF